MVQHFPAFTDSKRLDFVRVVLGCSFLLGVALSFDLWGMDRPYPLVPVIEGLKFTFLEPFLRSLLVGLSLAVIFGLKLRYSVATFSFLCLLAVLSDLNRMQPWVYQYILLYFVLSFFYLNNKDVQANRVLNAFRAVFCGIYFYAGMQKLNVSFFYDVLPWVMSPVVSVSQTYLKELGIFAAISEMSIGILLLFPRLRSYGIGLAVLMHSFLLYCLGPLGHDWNSIIWPWNICMPVFVYLLFHDTKSVSWRDVLYPRSLGHVTTILAFLVLPALSFVGMWDSYLSFKLYSGNTQSAVIALDPDDLNKLPVDLRDSVGGGHIDLTQWSLKVNNVPPYPEDKYFMGVMKTFCGYLGTDSKAALEITSIPDRRTGIANISFYSCSDVPDSSRAKQAATLSRGPSSETQSKVHRYFFF